MGRNLAGSYSGLVYLTTKTGAFVPGGPLESQNIEGVKKNLFCNAFLQGGFTDLDEIWNDGSSVG